MGLSHLCMLDAYLGHQSTSKIYLGMIQTWYMFFDCRLYIKPIPTITSNVQVAVPIHEICL